jgi:hypothetical protein
LLPSADPAAGAQPEINISSDMNYGKEIQFDHPTKRHRPASIRSNAVAILSRARTSPL